MKTVPDPGPRRSRAISETEIRERIRKTRVDLELYRLPSPERLQLLEKLVEAQNELIASFAEREARGKIARAGIG